MRISGSAGSTIPALTGVRIVPATAIFFFHWLFDATDQWPSALRAVFKQGYLAVAFFFALTGFLVALRYASRAPTLRYGRFVLHRFLRIYPLYFFVLTVFVLGTGRPESVQPKTKGDLLVLYAMLQSFSPPLFLAGIQTAWTLTVSEMFYLLAPLLLRAIPLQLAWRRQVALVAGLSALALGLAYLFSAMPAVPGSIVGAPLGYVLFRTIIGRLPEFLLGMLTGYWFLKHGAQSSPLAPNPAGSRLTRLIWPGILGMLACAVLMDALQVPEAGSPLFFALTGGVAGAAALTVLGLAGDTAKRHIVTRFFSQTSVVFLGKISYAVFLIQLTEPCQWLYWIAFGWIDGRWPRALALYVATLALGAALYLLIEKPIEQLIHRIEQKAGSSRMHFPVEPSPL